MTHRKIASTLVLLILPLAAISCASGQGTSDDPFSGPAGDNQLREPVRLVVENQNTSDATLYAIWGAGTRIRLGRAQSLRTSRFEFQWRAPDLRIEARFLAGGTYVSLPLAVSPGEDVELILPATLDE